eukprot:CAMPEP_0198211848 /NCGR_PEP_ID=MMETSP1445-20131203/25378_1 /TAXON_ID=36898 /ORGANISM="Pyramimonas sp., Strain CCMP2087" /LENGTH=94 /DNA_ID=CAMNT_0043886195 /DNA_START=104 /DNA_END=388 /DNA_ORIENTATION=+
MSAEDPGDPFKRLEKLEKDVEFLFQTKQLKEMRILVKRVTIICATLLFLLLFAWLGRPVFWSLNTLYGSQKYHSAPAADEEPQDQVMRKLLWLR